MNGLNSTRPLGPVSFAQKWKRSKIGSPKGMSHADRHGPVYTQVGDQWCALVSDAILFVYGIYIPEDRLWDDSVTGTLDKASVRAAFEWAQAMVVWKTDQSDEAVWPGHITPALWPLFWEVAFRVDREQTMTAIGYALTAFAYREYDAGKDPKSLDRHLNAGSPATITPIS
jgi:hypothetical protein